jgi:hypothetical protein
LFVNDCDWNGRTVYLQLHIQEAIMTAIAAIIAAAIGLVSGALGSLIAPWVHWGIEKRRQVLCRWQRIIDDCRAALDNPAFSVFAFRETPAYAAIREHLNEEARSQTELASGTRVYCVAIGSGRGEGNFHRTKLANEVARIEKQWKLV